MRIVTVDTFRVTVPLAAPMVMSNRTIEASDNVLVKVTTDDGIVGWGEGVEAPDLTGETQGRIAEGIRHLSHLLIGADPLARTGLWMEMRRAAPGSTTALAALDIALHDIAGRAVGVPVADLLGGTIRRTIPVLTLVGSGDPDADADKLISRAAEGYRWFKVKLALLDPDREVDTLARAVEAAGPGGVVCGDANEGWEEATAGRFLGRLEGLGVRFIEQPLPRSQPSALARLAARSPVPLCADESAGGLGDIPRMAELGFAGVSLKLIKHGGITGLMRGSVLCDGLGLAVNLAGKVAETSIAATANLHAAAAMGSIDYGCSPANQGLAADVTSRPPPVVDGSMTLPGGPGLGIDVDEDLVRALAT